MENLRQSDIQHLASLLNLESDSNSEEEDYDPDISKRLFTNAINTQPIETSSEQKSKNDYYAKCPTSKSIWSDEEILDEYDETENKEKPEYELIFQQDVTPNDIFLQMDGKGPGTNSCECLVVKIKLDDISSKNEIDLKVCNLSLICKTKKYYLNLNFPREVNPEKGGAKWDDKTHVLEVKLYIDDKKHLML